jgi:tetratricopeptide (TPR) repeat protein
MSRIQYISFIFGFLVGLAVGSRTAQGQQLKEPAIEKRLEMIKNGQTDELKAELPSLLTRYQNHPGVLYLQGVLTSDGPEAVKIFQSIVDNFPKSGWADDALYRIYQYYYSIGLYKTAAQKYERLKQAYPNSPYLVHGAPRATDREAEAVEGLGSARSSDSGTYTVQVGAFSTAENAGKQKRFFHSVGYPVEIRNKVKQGKSYYLVWIGNFKSYDEARKFRNEMKGKYKIEPIVVER